jgi:arylformamidase
MNWIDISYTITDKMVHWPGDVPVTISKSHDMNKGDEANVTALGFSAHTGTHIDAPLHFIRDGKDVSEIPLEVLIGRAHVVHVKSEKFISIGDVKDIALEKGDRILFRTRNSDIDWLMKPFTEDYVYLSADAAEYLYQKGIAAVGVDYLSVGGMENGSEVHRILLGNEILIIEGLALRNIEEGIYEMICLPLKIKSSDGSPARVIIRKMES